MASEIGGIIDQTLVEQAVEQTRINGTAESEFDPDMFIKLLSAQLQNQNPFDTVETEQIVQQQAIIAQVEQSAKQTSAVENQSDTLNALSDSIGAELASINQSITEIRDFIISNPEHGGAN
jgi:flagellar hook assembly protein FlgD